jgi:hypothetical protein
MYHGWHECQQRIAYRVGPVARPRAAGAHAVYDPSDLQRLHRDVHTASHHAIVDFDSLAEVLGRATLGLEIAEDERGIPVA